MENRPVPLKPVAGGRMLARDGGRVMLVAGAIPGERVRVEIERETRQVAWARVVEVLEPSPDRREPHCDPACGGSVYAHIRYERQLQLKGEIVADAFQRIGKITLDEPVRIEASPEHGYRLRARLHVHDGRAGFLREGTHTLCDAARTGQMSPGSLESAAAVLAALGDRASDIAEILVADNVKATERLLHLIPRDGLSLDDVASRLGGIPSATGITTSARDRPFALVGRATITDSAADLLGDRSPFGSADADVRWTRHASSFFQSNRFLIGALLRRVLDVTVGERLVDLYAGVGLFAVALAAQDRQVLAVEGDALSARDLAANAQPWRRRLDVVMRGVEDIVAAPLANTPDAVILDPPRTGLSAAALHGLVQWRVPRLVYVSCDPPTLARDVGKLVAAGYRLHSVDGFDLFPNTAHVETVAVLERE